MTRDIEWKLISEMAGLDDGGAILPPPPGFSINRRPSPVWKTFIGPDSVFVGNDDDGYSEVK